MDDELLELAKQAAKLFPEISANSVIVEIVANYRKANRPSLWHRLKEKLSYLVA